MRLAHLSLALCTACYSPSYRDCDVTCSTSQACPAGYQCSSSGFCVTDLAMTCTGSDGGMGDGGGGDATDAATLGPWSTPMPVPFVTGTPMNIDDRPTLTDNMLLIYVRRRVGSPPTHDVFGAQRTQTAQPFPSPGLIDVSVSAADEGSPELSPTGLEIYFSSNRSGSAGSLDLFYANRTSLTAAFSPPVNLTPLNSPTFDDTPAISRDGQTIVFVSDRSGSLDLYIANRMGTSWAPPMAMTALNDSTFREESPFLSTDKLTIYFASNRANGSTYDLYTATRSSTTSAFGMPQLITELAAGANERDPWVSMDGRTIYFTSEVNGLPTLMYATR